MKQRFVAEPGRTALVVGGSAGIGEAVVRSLASRGVRVGVVARGSERLETAVSKARAQAHQDAQVVCRTADATDGDSLARALEALAAELGAPDVVMHFAGRARPDYFEKIPASQLDETLQQNVHTAWHTAKAALLLFEARGGHLVLTSSLAGLIGVFGYTDYCASKFAVVGLAEALRAELRPRGIQVCLLCPPDTDTPGYAEEELTKPAETKAVSSAANLLSSEAVAASLLAGLARGRKTVLPGRETRLAALAARHFPGLVDAVQSRQIARAIRAR